MKVTRIRKDSESPAITPETFLRLVTLLDTYIPGRWWRSAEVDIASEGLVGTIDNEQTAQRVIANLEMRGALGEHLR